MKKLKIVFISSETAPYSKTGGLADVSGALPEVLASLKHQVIVFTPKYHSIKAADFELKKVDPRHRLFVTAGGKETPFNLLVDERSGISLKVYFIDCPEFSDRSALYVDPKTGRDYPDNDIRFAFFARAILHSLERLNFKPDIIHANDWQSAMLPTYLKTTEKSNPFFANTRSLLTIHNIGYQGLFDSNRFANLGIEAGYFYPTSPFEYWGKVSFLKAGILFADLINTVSETYAKEIQTSDEYGLGLEGVLRDRADSVFGVLNGVNYDVWSPEVDKLIEKKYSIETLEDKYVNKRKLLLLSGLSRERVDKPLIGAISRLADQKGFDLIAEIADQLFSFDFTFVLLGTGDKKYHELFEKLQKQYPDRIKVNLTFDERLAHMIEAGSDMFLMPSRYEPCGLNQMYSLKYGTVPVARKTGGLADTIIDETANKGKGSGFLFEEYSGAALLDVIKRALLFYENKRSWHALIKRGMKQDFSWKKSAKKYIELYQKALER